MGALKIDCYLNESQMDNIVKHVEKHLANDWDDFDDTIEGVRVCASFDKFLDKISIKQAEILDADYLLLEEDTAVFKSRLTAIVRAINLSEQESINQAKEIRNDQTYY